jgi:hypothetical protein
VELVVIGPGAEHAVSQLLPDAAIEHELPTLGGIAFDIAKTDVDVLTARLQTMPGVETVHRSAAYSLFDLVTPNDPGYEFQWRHARTGTDRAWLTTTGDTSTTIAIVDTGVRASHPDLQGRVLAGHSVHDRARTGDVDSNGHGTAVALVAAAAGNNGTGGAGSCWSCAILPVNVQREDGSIRSSDVAEAIRWATANGADIINLSLGGPHDPSVEDAVEYAARKGVLLVAAAGNSPASNMPQDRATFPARYPSVLGVEASNRHDGLYGFSHYGQGVDVAAPGCDHSPMMESGSFCGTSAAAPAVSGIAALAYSAGTLERPAELRNLLAATAVAHPGLTAGRVDADGLLRAVAPCGHPSARLLSGRFREAERTVIACFDVRNGDWRVQTSPSKPAETNVWTRFATRTGWQEHLVGDVGGDGLDDVLSYHPGTGNWILARSTGERFDTSVWARFRTTSGWQQHLTADVTKDGRADVMSYHPGTGNWILTTDDGGGVRSRVFTTYRTRTGWEQHHLADITGNGYADLISYHPGSGNWVLTPAGPQGAGPSTVLTRYRTKTGWAKHLLGDVDGDGRADLLSFHPGTGNWVITRAASGGSSGVFTRYDTTTGWSSHHLADVTGDQKDELVSTHGGAGTVVVTPDRASSRVWARTMPNHWEAIAVANNSSGTFADLLLRDGSALRTLRSNGDRFVR